MATGRVTMSDVAARAGVSRALVSIVFRGVPGASEATRERVRVAAADLGYRPDRRAALLGSRRSRTVGVVFGLQHEFHGELVEELHEALEAAGYHVALGASGRRRPEDRAVDSLLDLRCEALLLVGSTLPRRRLEGLAEDLPVVALARGVRTRACDVVRTDDVAGAALAADHLIGLGHTRIALLDGGRAPGAAERRRGHATTLGAHGLSGVVLPGGLDEASGEAVADDVLDAGVTGVAAFNDHCAAGLLAAVRVRRRSVPRRLSLVGYDDSGIARLGSVDLTTVAQDAPGLAQAAASRVLARLEEGDGPREVVVDPRLVVRGTTALPPRR